MEGKYTEPRPLRETAANDGAAQFSPDGRWLAYWSEESGVGQVYLVPWPDMTPIHQVSTNSGGWMYWRGDSKALVYQEGNGTVMSVDLIEEDGRLRLGAPVALFDHAPIQIEGPWLDMTADGERFLAINSASADPPPYCDVILKWPGMINRP